MLVKTVLFVFTLSDFKKKFNQEGSVCLFLVFSVCTSSTIGVYYYCPATAGFLFRMTEWVQPLGISFMTLHSLVVNGSFDLSQLSFVNVIISSRIEFGNRGHLYDAMSVYQPHPLAFGTIAGYPIPIERYSLNDIVQDFTSFDVPGWLAAVLEPVVLMVFFANFSRLKEKLLCMFDFAVLIVDGLCFARSP